MADRDRSNRELGFYIGLGILLGAALGVVGMAFTGDQFWVAVGAGAGLILATAFAVGLGSDQG